MKNTMERAAERKARHEGDLPYEEEADKTSAHQPGEGITLRTETTGSLPALVKLLATCSEYADLADCMTIELRHEWHDGKIIPVVHLRKATGREMMDAKT